MTPDEGKIFTNGEQFTDYICILSDKIDTMEWYEVSKEVYYETIEKMKAAKQPYFEDDYFIDECDNFKDYGSSDTSEMSLDIE